MTTYTNTSDEPITVNPGAVVIQSGEEADLDLRQERSPQAQLAIRTGRLVAGSSG